jgi:putative two-component system response regulator
MSALVLVVEDDEVMRRAISKAVGGGVDLQFAHTGAEALDALASWPPPAFVLLDFMLPDMDGHAVLHRIRGNEATRTLPVVMFSSASDPARVQLALESGANSWVKKADDPQSFERAVKAICAYWLGVHAQAPLELAPRRAR